ncbi:hypothetical protein DMH03_38430 [Amycolatopsis sp. WAC 01376]|nr:hypothetical protein DMH03_38430 [Amycolatopsis sp. WAC 01376]
MRLFAGARSCRVHRDTFALSRSSGGADQRLCDFAGTLTPKYMKAPFLALGARKGAFMYFTTSRRGHGRPIVTRDHI